MLAANETDALQKVDGFNEEGRLPQNSINNLSESYNLIRNCVFKQDNDKQSKWFWGGEIKLKLSFWNSTPKVLTSTMLKICGLL